MKPEDVRLVIWDLDDTFWRGTHTEGGIQEYIAANHDIVIELSRRGIISSICSKNDFETIKNILIENGIWEYFVFPSIDWSPKGERIRKIIENFQLRPPTVIFIDDNPSNLAEAAAIIPELQVESEVFLSQLLSDNRFKGKNDEELSRLKQYKLFEKKHQEQMAASGSSSNIDFLRSCGVTVSIEHDVERHIDRAVELINRTNQLNFTKIRLPEDIDEAKRLLRDEIRQRWNWSGLVHVHDRYGDYGYVGFYLGSGNSDKILRHFCFSCRTIGMEVERWVYQTHLGMPKIKVRGEVIGNLDSFDAIDWINNDGDEKTGSSDSIIQEVRLRGGCELDSIVHYFGPNVKKCVETNYSANHFFLRRDTTSSLLAFPENADPRLLADLAAMGVDPDYHRSQLFAPSSDRCLIVLSLWGDNYVVQYHHKASGLNVAFVTGISEPRKLIATLNTAPEGDISSFLTHIKPEQVEQRQVAEKSLRELGRHFDFVGTIDLPRFEKAFDMVLASTPENCRVVVILPPLRSRQDGTRERSDRTLKIRDITQSLSSNYDFVRLVDVEECVMDDSEAQRGWHFHRIVYFRIYQKIFNFLCQNDGSEWSPRNTTREARCTDGEASNLSHSSS